MGTDSANRFPRSLPYWPVFAHPMLRRVLPGLAVSALGDGMSVVAIGWLALRLAPGTQGGTWVAAAVAAYTLPAAAGTFLFRRLMAGRPGAQLAGWSATLRAAAFGAIPVVYLLGGLSVGLYVALLGASSLLASWGSAGRYTLVAELLPQRHHLAANAVLNTIAEFAGIAGPPLAGILIGLTGPVPVIAIDAASFGVLAATYRLAVPRPGPAAAPPAGGPGSGGYRLIWRDRSLAGLLALTFGFFLLFGPVYVALPLHVAQDLHAPATVLGIYYTAFTVGAAVGGLAVGYLRRWPLWPTIVAIVILFGLAMLPLGLGMPAGVALAGFALAGTIWAPYMPLSMALFQRAATPERLPQILAANGSITVVAVPLGTVLGGPLVSAVGARTALLACATGTLALGTAAASLGTLRRGVPAPAAGEPRTDPGAPEMVRSGRTSRGLPSRRHSRRARP